ncbi:MAG: hydantoinase B/oxoprolinase family protein [Pseudomonadota bacterium]
MSARHGAVIQSVLAERLRGVADDIGHLLIRGAFSSNIKERRDCSTAVFDAQGRLLAQADHMPIHIGSLLWGLRALMARTPAAEMTPGDAFVMNDPYVAGGTHLPDISVITPVFVGGAPRYFVGNIAHHADVGGPTAGSVSGRSPSIFHEGVRIPPLRIARGGTLDRDVVDLIALNTREPTERALDLATQVGANAKGVDLLARIVADMGADTVERGAEALIEGTRKRLAEAIKALPDGTWTATRYLDDDGAGDAPVALVATAIIDGDRLTLDFSGSGEEAKGAVNLSASSLEATAAYCVKALIDPAVLSNQGLMDAFHVVAPEGSVVNPSPPAAVAARAVTSNRLAGAIFDALGPALPPERRMAASNDSTTLIVLSGSDGARRQSFVYPESIGGGAGAFADRDGMSGVHVHTVNSTNLPLEILEQSYPLRATAYGLCEGSGGDGRQRGGLGIVREVEALRDDTHVTLRSDGHKFPAPGADGGGPGSVTKVLHIRTDGQAMELPSKTTLTLKRGERIRVETLGGGGFGRPEERTAEARARDCEDGL